MLIYNFADWTEWNLPQKVTFLPEEKLISIHPGETQIDVQVDLYSAWKEWIRYYDNAKWAAAFTTFGGDPTGVNQYAPRYFFLTNGWKVHVSNLSVVVQMNLYSDDGLSPFVIENAAVTNRASDVPIIKSELEERLDYGDRVYYDETSSYSGTLYPVGTIAQPVNNPLDAISIAQKYNISNFYTISDINLPGVIGQLFENYSIYADNENLTVTLYNNNVMNNMDWHGLIIDGNFYNGTNKFVDCIIVNALNVSGQFKNCQIDGNIKVSNNVVLSSCYSGIAGSSTPVFDMNSGITTKLSIRSYSGGVELLNCDTSGCTTTIELIAGQVKLHPTCSSGYIDIRGVGYLTNNSNGSVVKTSGFVTEFPLSSDDIDKLASLTGLTELLVLTGMTEQLNTIETEVILTNENVLIVNDNLLELSGMTNNISYQLTGITIGIDDISHQLTGITSDIDDISYQLTGITSGIDNISYQLTGITFNMEIMHEDIKRILGLTQENFRIIDQVYDSRDLLQSATIKIYNNSNDCINNINSLAEYSMSALYDSNGRLTDYKVIKS